MLGLIIPALLVAETFAYPHLAPNLGNLAKPQKRASGATYAITDVTSSAHRWVAPGTGDQRGPCPGLNAAANHNYVPHSGVMTITQAANGIQQAYGISPDFAVFLATVGALQSGDGVSFSIGGPPPATLVSGTLLGQGRGLSFSHNKFEGDGSPTRGDVYQYGEGSLLKMNQFKGMLALPVDPNDPNYTFDVLAGYSVPRFEQGVSQNPYYFRGVVGAFIPPGTLGIISRLFSNYSSENPNGYLSRDTLMSFFAISGTGDDLQYTAGHERIPEHFSRVVTGDLFSTAEFFSMTGQIYTSHTENFAFGGNTGTVNSFTGLDYSNFTGGVYNAQTLLQGNNLFCFVSQATTSFMPELISNSGVITNVEAALEQWNSALNNALGPIVCPKVTKFNEGALMKYPGWTKLKADGTY